jgi:glutathione S-transferase
VRPADAEPPMLTLHFAPDNASLVLRLALEEAQLPYRAVLVDRATRAQKSPAYLALNPVGLIPTLETPEGPIAETGACLLWLCDTYPGARLGPAVGEAGRGSFLRWLFYLSNTVHADLIRVFHPERYAPEGTFIAHHRIMTGQVSEHLAILDAAARAEPALFAPPSALALYLGPLLRWAALYPVSAERWLRLGDYPALHALCRSLDERGSTKAAIIAEGLGEKPFTEPRLPDPPVGSAI